MSKRVTRAKKPTGKKAVFSPKGKRGVVKLSPAQIAKQVTAQKKRAKVAERKRFVKKQAREVRDKYRPRKSERGNLVLVGLDGKRIPKGNTRRKGVLVYVTTTGKKYAVEQIGKTGFSPVTSKHVEIPDKKIYKGAKKRFQRARREVFKRGGVTDADIRKGGGSVNVRGTADDFNERVVKNIAGTIVEALENQESQRTFIVTANIYVKGERKPFVVQTNIERGDRHAIHKAGVENFVRLKFYASLARELSSHGLVTSGSANHIRRLKINKGKPRSKWKQADGDLWRGVDKDVVKIDSIEWQIEQAVIDR